MPHHWPGAFGVIPAKAGIHTRDQKLGPRFRGDDKGRVGLNTDLLGP